jgi:hypothetical protein
MTNKEKFLAGHPFALHGYAVRLRTLYGLNWLVVDNLQKYYIIPSSFTDEGFAYEIMFTPFDSTETLLFDNLKFIG